ncbi:MAG TPA: GNAT family N-acetyltransferase [Solirubrobacterales bacterium]|nr:GNAT family N-acetyltransferase [Solirubrobacterales bacterium]
MIAVADNPGEGRYEIRVDGELAGFSQYRLRPEALAFIHTEVDDRFEGQGLGGQLISFALDDVRSRGLAVLPFCPFVKGYIERHPEYLDLVPAEKRGDFGLGD